MDSQFQSSHHALTGLRRPAARLLALPERTAASERRNPRRRRLDRRRHLSGTESPAAVGSAPIDDQSGGRRRRFLHRRILLAGAAALLLLLPLVGELIELAGEEFVVPHESRRALSPERYGRSLQALHIREAAMCVGVKSGGGDLVG